MHAFFVPDKLNSKLHGIGMLYSSVTTIYILEYASRKKVEVVKSPHQQSNKSLIV